MELQSAICQTGRMSEGRYEKGVWVPGRRLNSDETNQGRHLFVPSGQFTIHRIRLYEYR